MSWFLVILFLSLTYGSLSEASHDKKLPSVVVVGTVYCDTCFQQDFSMGSHFISGASVAVECKDESSKPRFKKEVKTNEHGEFRVRLPFSVSKHVKRIKGCTVKLLSSSEPYCAVASEATSSSLRLKSRKQGLHIFSAGFFSFKPLKQPNLCNQKPSIHNTKGLDSVISFLPSNIDPLLPPPLQDPNTPGAGGFPTVPPLPTLPGLPPLPYLPPLPSLPGIPVPGSPPIPAKEMTHESIPTKTSHNAHPSDQKMANPENLTFPPNPFFPPPIVPNPLQPPPLVPNPLQPPPLVPNPNPLQPPPIVPNPNPLQPPPLAPNPLQPPALIPNPVQPPSTPPFPNPFQPSPSGPSPLFPFPPLFPPPNSPGPPPSSTKNDSP